MTTDTALDHVMKHVDEPDVDGDRKLFTDEQKTDIRDNGNYGRWVVDSFECLLPNCTGKFDSWKVG